MTAAALIVLGWYLVCCLIRWRIGRHYCESFRLLSIIDLVESWLLLVELPFLQLWAARVAVLVPLVFALYLTIK